MFRNLLPYVLLRTQIAFCLVPFAEPLWRSMPRFCHDSFYNQNFSAVDSESVLLYVYLLELGTSYSFLAEKM
jgi:hypothetical protein